MPNVKFNIGNQIFDLECEEDQKKRILLLAENLDKRVKMLSSSFKSASNNLVIVIAALMLEDEIINLKKDTQLNEKYQGDINNLPEFKSKLNEEMEKTIKPVSILIEGLVEKINKM